MLLTVVCAVVALLGSGCAAAVDGQAFASPAVSAGIDPGFVKGNDGGDDDRLAAAVLHDLEGWWGGQFPKLANGARFTPLKGYFSVDSSHDGPGPPCTESASEVEGNAFYCPRADIIAYDRAALLPVLRQKFGDSAVIVVIAHEFGHAVQQRLEASSPTAAGLSSGAPTILSEGQADCYAGGFLRAVHDGATPDLRTGDKGIDAAMNALITFRDPVGTDAADDRAHGNAFDRVSSFQDGYDGGPAACAGMTLQNRTFTQQSFATLSDAQSGGNLPLPDLLRAMGTDLDRYFGRARPAERPPVARADDPRGRSRAAARIPSTSAPAATLRRWWSTTRPSPGSTTASGTTPAARCWRPGTHWPRWPRWVARPRAHRPGRRRCAWPARTPATSASRARTSASPPATSTRPSACSSATTPPPAAPTASPPPVAPTPGSRTTAGESPTAPRAAWAAPSTRPGRGHGARR